MDDIRAEFKQPGSLYRGKPFWAWNGKLEKDELLRQIDVMRQMGFGGFFMHSRTGLETPYLQDEWFALIRACCEKARALGMEAWLYDEDRWPSGAAGGLVTKDERYRAQRLVMRVMPAGEFSWPAGQLAAFLARIEDQQAFQVERLPQGQIPAAGETRQVLAFSVMAQPPSSWYNGQSYLDTLSHEAVRKFIEITHEEYRKRSGDFFGTVAPGIFTDEPQHEITVCRMTADQEVYFTPWTGSFPETFQRRYGYDLLDHLPAVFFDIDGQPANPARHHYHDCRTFLFTDAFARQIGQWCEQNKILMTGHVNCESPLMSQAAIVGSAMRFYEHMHAPGIDILTATHAPMKEGPEHDTAVQCASVARQMGRRWIMSELYGCVGWDFSFEGFKAVGDWQAALGVNLRVPHLAWYTMAGEAKRDYPACINYQSPWWRQYRLVEDYFARVGAVLSRGAAVRDLLVVHPLESGWQQLKVKWNERADARAVEQVLERTRAWLLEEHIDFDYGDEEMLSRLARVETDPEGTPRLIVGQAHYKVMLIPPLVTVRTSTLDLARRFAEAGGKVIWAGEAARYVDGQPSPEAQRLRKQVFAIPWTRNALAGAAEPARRLHIRTDKGREETAVLYMLREENGDRRLFICNTDRTKPRPKMEIILKGPHEGVVEEWDPQAGAIHQVPARRNGEQVTIETDLPASGSRLFVFADKPSPTAAPRPVWKVTRTEKLAGPREYSLSEPNVAVLDYARFRLGGKEWQERREILKIDQAVRAALGIAPRGGDMVQPWARTPAPGQKPAVKVELEFAFAVEHLPASAVLLALETPARFNIRLNGSPISTLEDTGWWVDKAIRLLPLDAALLKVGHNTINLEIDYTADDGLETIFLLGHFGVRVSQTEPATSTVPALTKLPPKLGMSNWVGQGLPFYAGAVSFHYPLQIKPAAGERVFVEAPAWAGACLRVLLNGREAGLLGWPPYELDITDYLQPGANRLTLAVIGHRRNAFGPLHLKLPHAPEWTGPAQFITQGDLWMDEYKLVPCGLLKPPRISYRSNSEVGSLNFNLEP